MKECKYCYFWAIKKEKEKCIMEYFGDKVYFCPIRNMFITCEGIVFNDVRNCSHFRDTFIFKMIKIIKENKNEK